MTHLKAELKDAPYVILISDSEELSPAFQDALTKISPPIEKVNQVSLAINLVKEKIPAFVLFGSLSLSLKDFCSQLQKVHLSEQIPVLIIEGQESDIQYITSNGYIGWVESLPNDCSTDFFQSKMKMYLKMSEVNGDPSTKETGFESINEQKQQSSVQLLFDKEREELKEKLAEAQNLTMLGRLASGVAHDLNNILGGILGYAELTNLRFGTLAPEVAKYSRSIMDFTKRASELTKEILTFASPSKPQSEVFDSHQLVSEVVDLLSHLIDKKYQIKKRLLAVAPVLNGDVAQLQNALVNLSLNARDAMPDGGELHFYSDNVELNAEEIRILGCEMEEGLYLKLSVEDTGLGMSEEVLENIFKPFYTTKEKGKGTGLGLPSVLNAVKIFHGGIRVVSHLNKGTCFELYFPVSKSQEVDVHRTMEIPILKGNGNILVVDDEEALLEIIGEMLKDAGYSVLTAQDGLEALELYRKHYDEIDLVIFDLNLPRMTGQNSFLELKKINPNVKAILSTGFSMNEQAKSAMQSGMLAFIQKPFEMGQLLKTISKVLKK